MPTPAELRKSLQLAKTRLRETEELLLEERRKEKELAVAYGEVQTVRPSTLPLTMQIGG